MAPERLQRWHPMLVRRPRALFVALLVGLVVMGCCASRVNVDVDPYAFFQKKFRVTQALDHFAARKFGLYIIDVVLIPNETRQSLTGEKDLTPEDLALAKSFQEAIGGEEARPEVRKVISTMDVRDGGPQVKLQWNLWEVWKSIKRRIAYKRTFKDWMQDRAGEGAVRITFMVYDPGTGFGPLVDDVRQALPGERFDCICTGTAVNTVELSEGLVGGITRGVALATLMMSLLCAVLFRSLRLTLIAFLPNAFPVLVVFALMGILGVPLNSGSAMVTTVALGVGLNDTVHFVMHYRRRRLEGADTDAALHDTFGDVGRPIVLTSIVNCLGFGIFLLADFRPMHHFGLLASVAMAAALVGDLVLLPNLLKLFDSSKSAPAADAASDLPPG